MARTHTEATSTTTLKVLTVKHDAVTRPGYIRRNENDVTQSQTMQVAVGLRFSVKENLAAAASPCSPLYIIASHSAMDLNTKLWLDSSYGPYVGSQVHIARPKRFCSHQLAFPL